MSVDSLISQVSLFQLEHLHNLQLKSFLSLLVYRIYVWLCFYFTFFARSFHFFSLCCFFVIWIELTVGVAMSFKGWFYSLIYFCKKRVSVCTVFCISVVKEESETNLYTGVRPKAAVSSPLKRQDKWKQWVAEQYYISSRWAFLLDCNGMTSSINSTLEVMSKPLL